MGERVPAGDMPSNIVPASDLPSAPSPAASAAPVTSTKPAPTLGDIGGGGLITAVGEIPRNMAAQAAGGLSGLARASAPGEEGSGAQTSEDVSRAVSSSGPSTRQQSTAADLLGLPGRGVSWLAKKVGARGAQVSPTLGTIGETSVEALPVLLGARSGMKPKAPLTPEQARVAAARDAGYKMTPQEMGAGALPRTAASLAGEPRLGKKLTAENQPLMVEKAKADLGIPAGEELSIETLKDARTEAHAPYEKMRQLGDITTDSTYLAEAEAIGAEYRSAAKSFPKLATKDVEAITEGLKVQRFNASEAIDQISILRKQSDEFFRKGDTRLALANRAAADMIEAQIGRHLEASGQGPLLAEFRAARERIAKTYAVQKALVGDDAINPQALAKRVREGKPLTGNLREVADFARDFERSSQKPTHQATGPTVHDAGLTLLNAIRTGGGSLGWDLASLGARPAARAALASRPAQWAMDPRTNMRAMELLGVSSIPRLPPEE